MRIKIFTCYSILIISLNANASNSLFSLVPKDTTPFERIRIENYNTSYELLKTEIFTLGKDSLWRVKVDSIQRGDIIDEKIIKSLYLLKEHESDCTYFTLIHKLNFPPKGKFYLAEKEPFWIVYFYKKGILQSQIHMIQKKTSLDYCSPKKKMRQQRRVYKKARRKIDALIK